MCILSVQVDFSQLQMNTLRRYKRHFKMQVKPGLNKAQLAEARERHSSTALVYGQLLDMVPSIWCIVHAF